jgi:hypothetical protein
LGGNVYIRAERKIKTAVLEKVSRGKPSGAFPASPTDATKEGKRQVC